MVRSMYVTLVVTPSLDQDDAPFEQMVLPDLFVDLKQEHTFRLGI